MQLPDMPTQKLPEDMPTQKLPEDMPTQKLPDKSKQKSTFARKHFLIPLTFICSFIVIISASVAMPLLQRGTFSSSALTQQNTSRPTRIITTPTPSPTPIPFNPDTGAVLPTHRVVAFYGIPGAEPTGPAYQLDSQMLQNLQAQGAAYEKLDPSHPVQLGIDLVVSVPDSFPGPDNTYSHHVDAATIQSYIDFCKQNNLLLFLDLNIGWASLKSEVDYFLPYLEKYTFVHMAIDPEWMFPRHDGIPGTNLSNVRAADLKPAIEALAAIPMQYHVPRKILIIHQYRGDGDGLAAPYDASQAEIADKGNLYNDPRVDVVIHVDSVGGFVGDHAEKIQQYSQWVKDDMHKYHNFKYGGFKIFYHLEAPTGLMTPKDVLSMNPPPMVVTYGN